MDWFCEDNESQTGYTVTVNWLRQGGSCLFEDFPLSWFMNKIFSFKLLFYYQPSYFQPYSNIFKRINDLERDSLLYEV